MGRSTESTLTYIRGSVMRKILNHTSCSVCTNTLIEKINESTVSSFVAQMDFSGNSLLEPSSEMMTFFHILLSVYTHLKPWIKPLSPKENALKKLYFASLKLLNEKSYIIPFCSEHSDCYTRLMIQSTMKTFLKAFIHEMNENYVNKSHVSSKAKSRKMNILSKN